MSTARTRPVPSGAAQDTGAFAWWRSLGPGGRRAFGGAFGGYALDSYDYFALPLGMVAIAAYFGLDNGQTGLLTTVTPLVGFLSDSWGVGGALALGAAGYGLAVLALAGLPETRGRELA